MNILILDDDLFWLNLIYDKLSHYALSTNHDYYFYKCSNKKEVELIIESKEINVIISDLETNDKSNNIDFIKKISNKYNSIIIFVTNYENYALQSFGLNVYKYILKKDFESQAKDIIEFIENNLFKTADIQLNTYSGIIPLNYNDIYYIECFGHELYLHVNTTKYKLKNHTIRNLQSILPNNFILISRDTIVNINNISIIDNNEITLKNKNKLYISRRRRKDVYNKYCKNLEIEIK